MIEDIYSNIPKSGRTFKLYCFTEQCMEDFNKAFKEEVERIYGKENN